MDITISNIRQNRRNGMNRVECGYFGIDGTPEKCKECDLQCFQEGKDTITLAAWIELVDMYARAESIWEDKVRAIIRRVKSGKKITTFVKEQVVTEHNKEEKLSLINSTKWYVESVIMEESNYVELLEQICDYNLEGIRRIVKEMNE